MIIPSIDIMGGKVVQLKRGKEKLLERDDPLELAEYFSLFGPIAVIDLDAALGKGDNRDLMSELIGRFECRVGGGIRDARTGEKFLRAGAKKIIVGTAASPELLSQFHPSQTIAAIDSSKGKVVDKGWTAPSADSTIDRLKRLEPYCGEFLFTNVDVEGTMQGLNKDLVESLRKATHRTLTIAGGIAAIDEIAWCHKRGMNVQLGMSIYSGKIKLEDALVEMTNFDKYHDKLVPTIAQDPAGNVLMVAFSSRESLTAALTERRGIYFSRSRNEIWRKGDTSNNVQKLLRVNLDCDFDTILFTVDQSGPACHTGRDTCFGDGRIDAIGELSAVIADRISHPSGESYTSKLVKDPALLREKLLEEARETADFTDRDNLVWEAADLLYFLFTHLASQGVTPDRVFNELLRRRR